MVVERQICVFGPGRYLVRNERTPERFLVRLPGHRYCVNAWLYKLWSIIKNERKDICRLPLVVHCAKEGHTTLPSPGWRDLRQLSLP